MIDWVSAILPLPHSGRIDGGEVVSLNPDGSVEWCVPKRAKIRGSHDATIQVRTSNQSAGCDFVELSGNPAKWFQGHNLFGTDDLYGLILATGLAVADKLGLEIPAHTWNTWVIGAIQLTRIDVNIGVQFGSKAEVLAYIRLAGQSGYLLNRGRGELLKGSTLYFGKSSRRSTLKMYAKGQEIRAKGHKQELVLGLPSMVEWADRLLRIELTLRSMELKRLGLDVLANWMDEATLACKLNSQELLQGILKGFTMNSNEDISAEARAALRPNLRAALAAWEGGADVSQIWSKATYYRYRKELLRLGVDIASVKPPQGSSNVVPLHKVLEGKYVTVPPWAYGTPLYFEPPVYRKRA